MLTRAASKNLRRRRNSRTQRIFRARTRREAVGCNVARLAKPMLPYPRATRGTCLLRCGTHLSAIPVHKESYDFYKENHEAKGSLREGAPDGVGWGRTRCLTVIITQALRRLPRHLTVTPPSRRWAYEASRSADICVLLRGVSWCRPPTEGGRNSRLALREEQAPPLPREKNIVWLCGYAFARFPYGFKFPSPSQRGCLLRGIMV